MKSFRQIAAGYSMGDRATRRIVIALSLSAFAEWGGATSVLPLLPIYLHRHGSSLALVGITMAAFFAAAVVVQYPLGRLSDRLGRRTIQITGLVAYALGTLLFALVRDPIAALAFRALQGAGTGIVDVANSATIGEVVPEEQRGRAFSMLYGTRTVGMAIGPFLGGILGLANMRWLFIGSAVVVLVAAVPIFLFAPRRAGHEPLRRHERTPLWRNKSVTGVGLAFLASGIVVGVYEVCWSLLLIHRHASSWEIGLSWTLFALPFAVMSLPAGWLVDHMDRRVLVFLALAGSAAFASLYPFLPSVALLVALGAGEALFVALGMPAESAQLSQSVDSRELGRAQGAVSTAQTAAMAVSASVAGTLFAVRTWLPFVSASSLMVVCMVAIGVLWRGVPGRGSALPARPGEEHPAVEAERALLRPPLERAG